MDATVRHEHGLGLPEALIALALLGVALGGLLAAQWRARDLQQDAWSRHQAGWLLTDFGQRMALNPGAREQYLDGLRAGPAGSPPPGACARLACPPGERARADVAFLAAEVRRVLSRPDWRLESCLDSPGLCLSLSWSGTSPSSGPDGACLDASGARRPGAHCVTRELP